MPGRPGSQQSIRCITAGRMRRTSCCRSHKKTRTRCPRPTSRRRRTRSRHGTLARPDYRFELDLVEDTVSCVLRAPEVAAPAINRATRCPIGPSPHRDHLIGDPYRGASDAGHPRRGHLPDVQRRDQLYSSVAGSHHRRWRGALPQELVGKRAAQAVVKPIAQTPAPRWILGGTGAWCRLIVLPVSTSAW